MSLWQLAACVAGWNKAQGGESQPEKMTEADFDAMLERNANWMSSVH
jgi:hypothetical protein